MKRFTLICVCFALAGVAASPAEAETWLVSSGDTTWLSGTTLPPGLPQYDYEWTLGQADILVDYPLPGGPQWEDILDFLEVDKTGSGSRPTIPFTLDPIEILLDGAELVVAADVLLGVAVVADKGYGTAHLDSLSLGQFGGYDVLDARFGGDLTVTPEPATVLLLSLGSLVLLRKRRSTKDNRNDSV